MTLLRKLALTIALTMGALTLPAQTQLLTWDDANNRLSGGVISGIEGIDRANIVPAAFGGIERTVALKTPFTVNLSSPVSLSTTKGLVLFFAQWDGKEAPTAVKVSGRINGQSNYTDLGYAYLLFRGGGRTFEFSNRVYGNGTYDSFQFEVVEVSSGNQAKFYQFNLFTVDDNEPYPAGRLDPLHAMTDYYHSYKDFKYISNKGILSHHNHYGTNADLYCTGTPGSDDYTMNTPWGEDNVFYYDGERHELPTFDKQGDSQMPHITEMTLYAMPGDVITLIPFYDLPNLDNYREKFSHWYGYLPKDESGNLRNQDYKKEYVTDNAGNAVLDFLVDPSAIVKVDNEQNFGYFGGSEFPRRVENFITINNKQYFVIGNYIDLCEFAEYVYQSKDRETTNAILVSDIECNGSGFPTTIGAYNVNISGNDRNVNYRGEFNGNGFAIKNLNINRDNDEYHAALFGMVNTGCYIHDLRLENINVTAGGRAAGLIGMAWGDVRVENVLVEGNIRITAGGNIGDANVSYAAGIIAYHNNGNGMQLNNVGFVGTVNGGYGNAGANAALVARADGGSISNSYADATIQNPREGASMYYAPKNNVTVTNSYMYVQPTDHLPALNAPYNIRQNNFSNVYPADPQAFHTTFAASPEGGHLVRVYGLPIQEGDSDFAFWSEAYLLLLHGNDVQTANIEAVQLTKSDEGYWYASVDNTDASHVIVSNRNQISSVGSDGNDRFSSDINPASISLTANDKAYDIFYDNSGIRRDLAVNAATNERIIVYNTIPNKKDYILLLSNNAGNTYTQIGADAKYSNFCVFNLPSAAVFNRTGLRYSVLPYEQIPENSPLRRTVASPLPVPAANRRLLFVKKEVPGWTGLRMFIWAENIGGNRSEWGARNEHTISFNDIPYNYYFVPTDLGTWNGFNFRNGNTDHEYQDAIHLYDGMMKVEITKVSTTNLDEKTGQIQGGYFNPIFFEYEEGNVPELIIDGKTYTAETITVDNKKYYYINFAPFHEPGPGFSSGAGTEAVPNPTVVSQSEIIPISNALTQYGVETPAQFYNTLEANGETSVYLDPRDFNTLITEKLGTGWTVQNNVVVPPMTHADVNGLSDDFRYSPQASHELRWYGTSATFYQPRKAAYAPNAEQNLKLDKDVYHIAADFAHEFNPTAEFNLDTTTDNGIIHEPILAFRYIWHVKDGKTFADANTEISQKNLEYLNNNSRAVSARAGADFQIRLNTLVPANNFTFARTNFYYKKGENSYARVPRVGIEVIDNQTGAQRPGMFYFDATTVSQGTRKYQDVENGLGSENANAENAAYQTADGQNTEFYRVLFCNSDNAQVGSYTVRLYALEVDGTTEIKTTDNARLYLDEYVITFLGENDASLLTEEELKTDKYRTHRAEYLEQDEVCGPPAVVVDFDQYRTFETEPYVKSDYLRHYENGMGVGHPEYMSYKWPMLWQKNSYSFGYGGYYNYDFNEYIIANHSSQVAYKSATSDKVGPNGAAGVFDRLFHDTYNTETKEGEMGYFYYVNAASDPGVAAKLEINNLCAGSTVVVSAWLCEMSYENEVANLCFNFVAVDRDGNREIVHSFVSGYVDRLNYGSQKARYDNNKTNNGPNTNNQHLQGQWMHVYYSFIPDVSSVQTLEVDHYELELENNCVSSVGADYAVDDIRAYIISPAITARQLNPVCDAAQKTIGIRISSRFDKLLDSNGLVEATDANGVAVETLPLHFAVIDKKKYDEEYDKALGDLEDNGKLSTEQLATIVKSSIIAMNETTDPTVGVIYFTSVEVSSKFSTAPEDTYSEDVYGKALYDTSLSSGTRYIRTNVLPYDKDLRPGKEYYIVLYAQYKDGSGNPLPEPTLADFAVTDDPCAKYAVMTLQGSGIIKIDGIAYSDGEPVEVCVGQSPVVQVDLKMITDGKEVPTPTPVYDDYVNAPNHYYDWFNGPLEEFMASTPDAKSYYDLLYLFRNDTYPDDTSTSLGNGNIHAAELPDPVKGETDVYAPLRPLIESGRLVLHASSFVFPPLVDKEHGENIYVLTAMPIIPGPDDENGYKVCSQPNEIRLHVQDNAPLMMDGFAGIEYPNADVPVRAGFTQLGSVSKLGNLTKAGTNVLEIDNTITKVSEDLRVLELPLRGLQSYKGEGTAATMTMAGNRNEQADPYVYLVETNDPSYIGLDKHPMDEVAIKNSLLPVGMVAGMSAKTGADNNNVTIVFDNQMQFSEGYYYRMRFTYDEVIPTEVEGYCEGHVVFTIKVVPEYAKWTGADSRNWNNDANWSRVSKDDILLPDNEENAEKIKNFTTSASVKKRVALIEDKDGVVKAVDKEVEANTLAYAPMDFTKVLVTRLTANDATEGYPYMFGPTTQDITTLRGNKTWDNQSAPTSVAKGIDMTASKEIEYDMAAFNVADGPLAVRPWYANTCEQIHFNHGAEMAHQESFVFGTNYQKAWVEMEMAADRWYTLGSPLQGVVAGDMYTKTAGGKQDNELFTDITFNNIDYGRYEPAVYQRGWNKAEAKTYMLGDNSHESHNSAVSLNWSRVYNDVAEPYAPGLGYSIRSTYPNGDDREETEKYFRFRLPKADTSYSYYDQGDNTEGADDTTLGRGNERHALTAFTNGTFTTELTVGTEGNYFLVGNPFIARMKMDKFFEVNKDVVDQAYWIMTSVRQDATLWDEKSGTFISTDLTESVSGVIAPMQGFFVKSKTKDTSLTLTFTPAMIDEGYIAGGLQLKSVPTFAPQLITVSALDAEGEVASRAVINIDPAATAAYDGAEDAALLLDRTLDDRATIYTVASEQALAINSLDGIVETEVGLLATEGTATTVLFEGIDEAEGLQLLDTATGTFTDMFDGMTVEVDGSASGRFYITRPASSLPELSLAVVLKDRTVSIVSSTEGIAARVYTPSGMYLGEWSVDDTVLHFDLDPGIFIVEAVADAQRTTRKFVVK